MQGPRLLIHALLGMLLWCGPAQAVQVWVPDSMSGAVGDTVSIPILVSGQVGQGVISADMTLDFGEAVLTATSANYAGNAAPGWFLSTNPMPCSLLIAMAGADPLTSGDTLLIVKMLADSADTTTVWFSRCRLNEGSVPCTTRAGKFYGYVGGVEEGKALTAADRILSLCPSPVLERAEVRCRLNRSARVRMEIRDPRGDVVRTLFEGIAQPGETRVEWNCEDNQGKRVPAGVYFCTLENEANRISSKVVVTR
jgi:hypothetical protein